MLYQVRVRGHLKNFAEWFDGLSILLEDNGDTVLTGSIVDQAALYGLLKKSMIWAWHWSRLYPLAIEKRNKQELSLFEKGRWMMKAIVCRKYGAPDVLQLEDVEKPEPKDNEVLIKLFAATATPSDCITRKGSPYLARLFNGLMKPNKAIMGVEFSGEIEDTGKDVKRFKKGDRVFGSAGMHYGAYAEYLCLSEEEVLVHKPLHLDDGEAACLCDGGLTALYFLKEKGKIAYGQKVLINGASGAVGTYAVQLAKHFGAEVTGVCSTANMELVRSLGADRVVDYTREDFTQFGQTYDILFDAVGKSSFSHCRKALKPQGIYLTTIPTPAIMLQSLWTAKSTGKKAIIGAVGLAKASVRIKGTVILKELVESGKIRTVIDRRYPLEQLAEAHRYVEKGHKKGNVVIVF